MGSGVLWKEGKSVQWYKSGNGEFREQQGILYGWSWGAGWGVVRGPPGKENLGQTVKTIIPNTLLLQKNFLVIVYRGILEGGVRGQN